MNAVHQLYLYRKSLSTTLFKARGHKVKRCETCRLSVSHCICDIAPNQLLSSGQISTNAGFVLLMYDTEVLKPSNTGKLIADLIPHTYAFLWSRTVVNDELQALLSDEKWQPFVVFPKQYAVKNQRIIEGGIVCETGKKPLFIMLDGSWREAKKMFNKSQYLSDLPIVSFDPALLPSRYQMRSSADVNHLATAEVAARVLSMTGETLNAQLLDLWFDVFSYQYQKSVCRPNQGNVQSLKDYQTLIDTIISK